MDHYFHDTKYYPLHPGRIVDVTWTRTGWKRTYDNSRRFFQFRYYYRGVRVPWLVWAMFS